MAVQVQFQPDPSVLETLGNIDTECFPGEPLGQPLSAVLRQDFWLAWHDGLPAGYAYVQRRPDVARLSRIGTAAVHRRHGVATSLLSAVLSHCAAIGLPETLLYVRTDNPDAIRLYERFGFRSVESSYQFILSDPLHAPSTTAGRPISAVPIDQVPAPCLPDLPREWSNIASMHRPPDTYVLVFRDESLTVGYCRLSPGFPGCFPFVVLRPKDHLMMALRALTPFLREDKDILKVTFWDSAIADECRTAGLRLNYELLKMYRKQGAGP